MPDPASNRHAGRSEKTRRRFIDAAQRLFAERGVDAVSLNAITLAAGQKNRNALQYHFGGREGLLQAIIDRHAGRVHELRRDYMAAAGRRDRSCQRRAARALVMPLARHIREDAGGACYVKILSQLAALNHALVNPAARPGVTFSNEEQLAAVVRESVAHLRPAEAQRRLFLTVSMTFHGLADICRAAEATAITPRLARRDALFEQLALSVEAFLATPPLER